MPPTQLRLEYIYRHHMHFLVLADHADEAVGVLSAPGGTGKGLPAGRGGVESVPFQDGHAVLRPCRRGGLIRHLTRDAYLFVNRPRTEFMVHCRAFEAGAPVPEPLGVRWRRNGPFVHGALLSRYVNAAPLSQTATNAPDNDAPHRLAGAAVAAFHAAGILHADLNAHNILVDDARAWVIDLDRARAVSSPTPFQRARNLLRLRRSYAKLGIPMTRFDALLEGYGPIAFPPLLRACHAMRQILAGRPQ